LSGHVRLLIIDDNPGVRRALEARLSKVPRLEVVGSVGDARSAQSMADSLRPDVVLLEPKGLDGKGIDLCQSLLIGPRSPVVVILTSFHDEREALALTELGVQRYMLKDIDTQRLADEILAASQEQALASERTPPSNNTNPG
jgi:DNA-binding NarL/FixJ family response regulator